MTVCNRRLSTKLITVMCTVLMVSGSSRPSVAKELAQPQANANEVAPKIPNDQLDSLVAPIALYPDMLLAQVLVASTYPLEISQLQQFLDKHKDLKDQALFDVPALKEILGPSGGDIVSSEDPVQDENNVAAFAAEARQKAEVTMDPQNSERAILSVGDEEWPLPIPIAQNSGGEWSFDTQAGREEVLYRRIGTNELDTIQVCRGYAEAQDQYALEEHDGVNQYAQRVIRTPGKRDGLAWQNPDGSWRGPVGEAIADALAEGYTDRTQPYHGYYFKVLKGQGPATQLAQMDFVVSGAMIGGFGLAAAPADYRVTGVKTFIVSYEGIVYEKDLGPDTHKIFKSMELYNPDETRRLTDDSW